ncbi:MAG: DUF2330 domain-containing protein [Sandaracinaceae bacterium]
MTSPRNRHAVAFLLSVTLLTLMRADGVSACAPVTAEGMTVRIAAEEALIVWDAARHTEHFIRRADFSTEAEEFGFLVPTPSPPQLAEVSDSVFESLRLETAPEEVTDTDWTVVSCCTSPFMLVMSGADAEVRLGMAGGVQVLSEQRVAGMDATVLAANDPDALGAWLGEHGYANRPALVEWLAPYVRDGFAVTAFRYRAGEESTVASRSVRMSFETDRPFYPFREPSDQPESSSRSLRVWLVGPNRMGSLSDEGGAGWSGSPEYARPVHPSLVSSIVPQGAVSEGAWLSSFLDRSSSRRGAGDAFFEPVQNDELRPLPLVHHRQQIIPAPVEPVIVLAIGIWVWRRRRGQADASD